MPVYTLTTGSMGALARLDQVHYALIVQGKVRGHLTVLLPGERLVERLVCEQRAVSVVSVLGLAREAAVEVLAELQQERVSSLHCADAPQAKLLDEAVLQRLIGALNAALRGGSVAQMMSILRSLNARPNCV